MSKSILLTKITLDLILVFRINLNRRRAVKNDNGTSVTLLMMITVLVCTILLKKKKRTEKYIDDLGKLIFLQVVLLCIQELANALRKALKFRKKIAVFHRLISVT